MWVDKVLGMGYNKDMETKQISYTSEIKNRLKIVKDQNRANLHINLLGILEEISRLKEDFNFSANVKDKFNGSY